MTTSEVITAVAIHLLVPLAGIIAFLLLCVRMWRANIPLPPYFSWFVLFGTFGGWLIVLLTVLFWKWSGMASLGVFALMLVAPLVTAGLAWQLRARRELSRFHRLAFAAAAIYSAVTFATLITWLGTQILAR